MAALVTDRSATAARSLMAPTAPTPSVIDLQRWVDQLPPGQLDWCAQLTATPSTARWDLALRVRSSDGQRLVDAGRSIVYLSPAAPAAAAAVAGSDTPAPTTWLIDAIVTTPGSPT